jgi:hypothetical protein
MAVQIDQTDTRLIVGADAVQWRGDYAILTG